VRIFGRSVIHADSDPGQGVARRRAQYKYGGESKRTRMDPYQNLTDTEIEILNHIERGGSHYFGAVADMLDLDMYCVSRTMRSMVSRLSYGKRRGVSIDNLSYIVQVAKSKGLI
jgi:hypothetical protein